MSPRRLPAAFTALYPVATARPRPATRRAPSAMMAERPAPRWIVATIRVVQGNEGALGLAMVGTSAALFAMMAISMLVAWQAGLV